MIFQKSKGFCKQQFVFNKSLLNKHPKNKQKLLLLKVIIGFQYVANKLNRGRNLLKCTWKT